MYGSDIVLNSNQTNKQDLLPRFRIDRYRIEVSLACDLRCEYCVVHMNKVFQRGRLMDGETAKKIINKFNLEVGPTGSLMLIGGEPLLNWEVVKFMISRCSGSSMIFTNAYRLDEDKIKFLKKHNTLILTSLDGYSLKHNKSRFYPNVKKNFNIVCKNISTAINNGCKVGIGCVVHPGNINDMEKIAHFFTEKLKAKSLSFAYPHFTTEETPTNKFPMEEYTKQMLKLFLFSKERKIYIDQIGKLVKSIFKKKIVFASCKAGLSQKTFYPDGSETICTKIDTIPGYDFKDFTSILPVNNKKCDNCVAQKLCGGGCPWDAIVFKNKIGVDRRICKHNKTLVAYILKDIEMELRNVKTKKEALEIIKDKYYPMMNPT